MIERANLSNYQLERIAQNLDSNNNGNIGIYELGGPESQWERLDLNRDGAVPQNEFVYALASDTVQLNLQGSPDAARKVAEALDEDRDGYISDREVPFSSQFEREVKGNVFNFFNNTDGRISVVDMANALSCGKVTLGRSLTVATSYEPPYTPPYNPFPVPNDHWHDDHGFPGHDDHGFPGHDDHGFPGHDDHGFPGHDDHGIPGHDDHGFPGHDDHGIPGHDDHGFPGHDDHGIPGHDDHGFPGHDDHGQQPSTPPVNQHQGGQPYTPPVNQHQGGQPYTPPVNQHQGGQPSTPPVNQHQGGQTPPPGNQHQGGQPWGGHH